MDITDFRMQRIEQMLILLQKNIVRESVPLEQWRFCECGYKKDNVIPDKNGPEFRDFQPNERWGTALDSHAWFCTHIDIPESWQGEEVQFVVKTGREGGWDAKNPQFIVYVDGVLTQGIDVNHTELCVTGKQSFDLDLYAYAGMETTLVGFSAELQLLSTEARQLYYDLLVPYEFLKITDPVSKAYVNVLHILNEAMNRMDCRVPGSDGFRASLLEASAYLKEELFEKYNKEQDHTVLCIGHTHIDCAWLWTLEQTKEKVQRSFSTVLQLMKQYPEYKFMSSQALLYENLKEESPETYEEVKQMIAAGRWEVEGAMWVEADCNLTSGESLVRQLLFGKRFFKQEFGVESRVLWLPDVFGYSAALPQILRKSGVDRFVTSKISWNEMNQMPYDMFRWRGLDGTEVFTHFLTAQHKKLGQEPDRFTTYVSSNDSDMIAGTWDRFQQKELCDQVINTFGYGDGGGGPTLDMLERLRRMKTNFADHPSARIGTATEFLDHAQETAGKDPKLPVWEGELYMEMHRGTYTSIARNKKYNRLNEFAHQNAELYSTMAGQLADKEYPQETLNAGWKEILTRQFHDIIPGSSIKEVYDECDITYPRILKAARDVTADAMEAIAENIGTEGGLLVFNPQSFANSGTVEVDGKTVFVDNIPAKGYAVVQPRCVKHSVKAEGHVLENECLRVTFDENFNIASIIDKEAGREVIDASKGPGNRLEVYEDYPRAYDAWEITNYYKEKCYHVDDLVSAEPIFDGARAGFLVKRKYLDSTVAQKIWLYEGVKRVDFDTEIDWKQEHLQVKTAFPVTVKSSRATYEVQFGALERPTHSNTSWDAAKFEVCAHKYCDLAEYDYGVSMLNDCKYGHDIHDGVMRLTFLKSATYPNPAADKCLHEFRYSLVPHTGDYRQAGIVQMAYDFNNPMTAMPIPAKEGKLADRFSLVSVAESNVIVDTVKKAEDSGASVLRLYEAYGKTSGASVTLANAPKRVTLCDLMENELEEVAVCANTFSLPIKPYEILTVKVEW